MLNLLYAFKRLLRDRGLIRKLSLLFGASGDQVDSALDASSPVILGRLAEIAEGEDGQERLSGLLDNADPEVLSSASDFLERDNVENDKLLTDLFGDDRSGVVGGISDVSGVSTNTVGALLPKLAPMLLGFLGRHRSDNGADAAEMKRVVVSERDEIARTERGASLLGLGTAAAGGAAFFGTSGEDNPNASTGDNSGERDGETSDGTDGIDGTDETDETSKPRRIHFEDAADASSSSDKSGSGKAAAVAGGAAVAGAAAIAAGKGRDKDDDKDDDDKDDKDKSDKSGKSDKTSSGKADKTKSGTAADSKNKGKAASTGASNVGASNVGASNVDASKVETTEIDTSSKSYSYGGDKTGTSAKAATSGSTTTTTRTKVIGDDEYGLGWLWWLLGLLAALIVLGLLLSQCGGDDDDAAGSDSAAIAESDEEIPVVTTSSPPETTTVAPTTVAPTTVAPTTVAPTTVPAPTTTTTLAPPPEPEPEPEVELGEPLTAGTLVGGFSLANALAEAGGDFAPGIDAQSSVASSGVEFAPFGPFNIDVGGESISMDWNEAPEFDDFERTIEAGEVEQYTFAFDDAVLAGVTASADESQSLVPGVSQPDDNTVVVEFGEGLTLGDGQRAVIVLTPSEADEPVEGPEMDALPRTGVETNNIAMVGVAFIVFGFGLTAASRRRDLVVI